MAHRRWSRERYVKLERPSTATGLVRATYEQAKRDFAIVQPLTLHSPAPRILAAVWGVLRETLLAGPVDRVAREAIGAAVSSANACTYCLEAHAAMLHGKGAHATAAQFFGAPAPPTGAEAGLGPLIAWARSTATGDVQDISALACSREERTVFLGTALLFHYMNRMVNVFLEDAIPLPSGARALRALARRAAGSTIGRHVMGREVLRYGASGVLFAEPTPPLPPEFAWAASEPAIAAAFARFDDEVDGGGRAVLPDDVRRLVAERVCAWDGAPRGPSRRWIDDAIRPLDERAGAAARLALLVAMAPHQIDDRVVGVFRETNPSDEAVVTSAAWASLIATKAIGARIARAAYA
jgi:AhpD family alkylhydroperoxidase